MQYSEQLLLTWFNKSLVYICHQKIVWPIIRYTNLPTNFIFLKTFNSEFSYIELWFTDQNYKLLEIEDKINITLVIN